MSKYLLIAKEYASLFLGGYMFCSFVAMNLNPLEWGELARLVFGAPVLVSIFGNKK